MSLYFTSLLLALFPQAEQATNYPRADLLMEPAALAKKVKAKEKVIILDARPKKEYEAGHVPGAYWVDAEKWAKTFAGAQDEKTWAPLLAGVGVRPKVPIVVYDNVKTKDAARIWWILRYWGFDGVRLLNGGWQGWQGGNHTVSKEDPADPQQIPLNLKAQKELHAPKNKVLDSLKSKTVQILDARSEAEYCGETKLAKKGGAIPGAMHLEWSEAIDPKTHRFKPASELSKLLKETGIDLDQPTITYCQSGGRASVMAFTLELMGAEQVKNYYRGWSEWGNAPDAPIVTPKKKE